MCAGGLFFSLRTKPLQVCSESQGHPHTGLFCSFMREKEVILARVCVDIGDVNFARNACKTHTFCKDSAPCCGVPEMSLGVKGKACVHRRGSRPAPRLQGTKGFGCARGTDAPKARAWDQQMHQSRAQRQALPLGICPENIARSSIGQEEKKSQTGVEVLLYGHSRRCVPAPTAACHSLRVVLRAAESTASSCWQQPRHTEVQRGEAALRHVEASRGPGCSQPLPGLTLLFLCKEEMRASSRL